MFYRFVINYSVTGKNDEEIAKIADALHKELAGNEDYVNSAIVINFRGPNLTIYLWPEECKQPIPDMLRSWAEFMIFCNWVVNNENN